MHSIDDDSQPTRTTNQTHEDDQKQQEESIMASATVDGTPFSVLMSQAIKMKSAQEAPTRSKYDQFPTF